MALTVRDTGVPLASIPVKVSSKPPMPVSPVFGKPSVLMSVKMLPEIELLVGGPELAAHALRAGVVDELRLVLCPVTVGAGTPAFPPDLRLDLELIDERRFGNGAVHVAYRVRR